MSLRPSGLSIVLVSVILTFGLAGFAQDGDAGGPADPIPPNEPHERMQRPSLPDLAREQAMGSAGMSAAQAEYSRAYDHLATVTRKQRARMLRAPELAEAEQRIQKAAAAYAEAKVPVLESIRQAPVYAQAMKERDRVAAQLELLKSTRPLAMDERVELAKQKMRFSSIAHEMEHRAIRSDVEVQEAHARLMQAQEELANVKRKLEEELGNNPEIVAARRGLQEAHERLIGQAIYFAGADAAYYQALEDRDMRYDLLRRRGGLSYPYYYYPYQRVFPYHRW